MSVLDGPGEGTWAVFAEKVVAQRDAARERATKLEARIAELEAELDINRKFYNVTVKERDLERLKVVRLQIELRDAKADRPPRRCRFCGGES